jgi:hypothetical protein
MSRTYREEYTDVKKSNRACRSPRHDRDDRLYSDNKWRAAADEAILEYYKEESIDSEE